MKHLKVLLCLAIAACAYSQTNTTIRGIRITSSTFDPQTREARLTFINDTPQNITAWGYCVHAQNAPGNDISHGFCTEVDPLVTVVWDKIEIAKRPFLSETDCPICRFVHPGENKTLSSDFGKWPEVIRAVIEINLVVFADGTAETLDNDAGHHALQYVANGRRAYLEAKQRLLKIGDQILADTSNLHPAKTMIHELELRAPNDLGLAEPLKEFKRPGLHRGDERELIPENEREYLAQYVADVRVWVDQYAKNQIKAGGQ